jgi:hypothetical protein
MLQPIKQAASMKLKNLLIASLISTLTLPNLHAQPPGMGVGMRGGMMGGPPGPHFGGPMAKLFEGNSAFSATLEFHTAGGPSGREITMPGKLEFLEGKSRFEMDMGQMQGASMPPQAIARMQQMGMDKMTAISRPDLKVTYILYPGMQAYVANPAQDADASAPPSDYKVDITKLADETVDGHPCEKSKVVATDKGGAAHEFTVWNATDLNKFPVKIESTTDNGSSVTMFYKDIKLSKPDASEFEPPADFKKYDSVMELMMSHARGGGMN